jgi:hypothetical protein
MKGYKGLQPDMAAQPRKREPKTNINHTTLQTTWVWTVTEKDGGRGLTKGSKSNGCVTVGNKCKKNAFNQLCGILTKDPSEGSRTYDCGADFCMELVQVLLKALWRLWWSCRISGKGRKTSGRERHSEIPCSPSRQFPINISEAS